MRACPPTRNPELLPWIPEHAPPDAFPHPSMALSEPNGLLASGGDLSPARLLAAYQRGIFPWFGEDEPILWWSPSPRAVIPPAELHVSRSLKRQMRQCGYRASLDTAFSTVMQRCAEPRPDQPGTWIIEEMQSAYRELHSLGHAHSIELWDGDDLIGGLYGVCCGRAFFGESMFSRAPSASKIAMAVLCQQLHRWHFNLLDCQVESEHLATMGAKPMPRRDFLALLDVSIQDPNLWRTGKWQLDSDLAKFSPTPA